MNNLYIHHKKNNLTNIYIYILIPLLLYGFYKNGILLFSNGFLSLIKPLLFPISSIMISLFIHFLFSKEIKITNTMVYFMMLAMTMPIKMHLLLFIVLMVLFSIISELFLQKQKFNSICLYKLLTIGVLYCFKQYNYANSFELAGKYSYDLLDIFIGRGISGICCSSMLIILIGYLFLCTNEYYKNEIPAVSLFTYLIGALFAKFIFHKVIIFNGMILFAFVFIASINELTPINKKERILYSICLGILTLLFTYFINSYDGVFMAILLSSFLNYICIK